MSKTKRKLGEMLLSEGIIDEIQLRAALAHQAAWGGRLGSIFVRKGFVKETDMIAVIEKQLGLSCLPLEEFGTPDDEALDVVKENIARKFVIFPLTLDGKILEMATSDPTDLNTLDDLSFLLGVRIKPVLALESDILTAIDHYYNPLGGSMRLSRRKADSVEAPESKGEAFEIIRDHRQSGLTGADHSRNVGEITDHDILEGVIELLIEAGIFTRKELAERIKLRRSSE